ncbi:phosphatidate cytidylyltransferase [Chitinilyticum litopenaei]|uniref:phosphatidate cytidylyltransferase n=1 Tax=Chitinilyticum litopenaei TaxID=1121276 RepID=UPI00040CBF9E|nr:phosphatidate cytidylyltransferase [Chitinilyticum litopenaei]
MLKTRILTALVLLPAFLAALLWLPTHWWAALCAGFAGLLAWEWGRLAGLRGIVRQIYPGLSAVLLALIVYSRPDIHVLLAMQLAAALFWCVLAPCWLARKWSLREAGNLNVLLGWAVIIPAVTVLAVLRGDSGWVLLSLLAIAWVADTAAYFSGKAFGRHKLAPQISPGKTWEGVLGAGLFVAVYCVAIPYAFPQIPHAFPLFTGFDWARQPLVQQALWVLFGLVLMCVSIVGDLLESLFKRQAGMKDSSNLLPGHGGVLDRTDSLLALLPVAAAIQLLSFLNSFPH